MASKGSQQGGGGSHQPVLGHIKLWGCSFFVVIKVNTAKIR